MMFKYTLLTRNGSTTFEEFNKLWECGHCQIILFNKICFAFSMASAINPANSFSRQVLAMQILLSNSYLYFKTTHDFRSLFFQALLVETGKSGRLARQIQISCPLLDSWSMGQIWVWHPYFYIQKHHNILMKIPSWTK